MAIVQTIDSVSQFHNAFQQMGRQGRFSYDGMECFSTTWKKLAMISENP